MRWSERQRAMLAEMGLRLWAPDGSADPGTVEQAERAAEPALAEAADTKPALAEPAVAEASLATREVAGRFAAGPVAVGSTAVEPAAAAVAALGWSALAARAGVCSACALSVNRTRPVWGSSAAIDADWVVVGDAPDDDDDQAGTPFAGPAGALLDNMLAAMRLGRTEGPRERRVYVTQSVKCRTPGRRPPEADELARCAPFLGRELELVRPRLILALGRAAAQALLGGTEPLGKLRGRVHRHGEAAVVVTYHPGHLLRHPEDKAAAWDDLCLALETMQALPAGPLA